MGKSKNRERYNKLYDELYQDASRELRTIKEAYADLQQQYSTVTQELGALRVKVKVQQQIIEDLEGGLGD